MGLPKLDLLHWVGLALWAAYFVFWLYRLARCLFGPLPEGKTRRDQYKSALSNFLFLACVGLNLGSYAARHPAQWMLTSLWLAGGLLGISVAYWLLFRVLRLDRPVVWAARASARAMSPVLAVLPKPTAFHFAMGLVFSATGVLLLVMIASLFGR